MTRQLLDRTLLKTETGLPFGLHDPLNKPQGQGESERKFSPWPRLPIESSRPDTAWQSATGASASAFSLEAKATLFSSGVCSPKGTHFPYTTTNFSTTGKALKWLRDNEDMCEAGTEMLRMSRRTVLPSKDPEAPFALADPGVVSFRSSESSAVASNETGDGVVLHAEIDAEGDGVATREYWDVVVKNNLCRAYPSLDNEAVHILKFLSDYPPLKHLHQLDITIVMQYRMIVCL